MQQSLQGNKREKTKKKVKHGWYRVGFVILLTMDSCTQRWKTNTPDKQRGNRPRLSSSSIDHGWMQSPRRTPPPTAPVSSVQAKPLAIPIRFQPKPKRHLGQVTNPMTPEGALPAPPLFPRLVSPPLLPPRATTRCEEGTG
jgi:hypothetical protein